MNFATFMKTSFKIREFIRTYHLTTIGVLSSEFARDGEHHVTTLAAPVVSNYTQFVSTSSPRKKRGKKRGGVLEANFILPSPL